MQGTHRSYVALAVMGLGLAVAAVGPRLAPSRGLALALAGGGSVTALGSVIVLDLVYGEGILPSSPPADERTRQIERHATRNSWFVFVVSLFTAMMSWGYLPRWFRQDYFVKTVLLAGLLTLGVSWLWYERRM